MSTGNNNAARQLAFRLDPPLLMEAAGMPPDDWQRGVLRSRWQRALLLCSRQAGKSTVTAALATHRAAYTPGALVLLLAPAQRQSSELFQKVLTFYHAAGDPVPVAKKSALRMRLKNGSRIVALPGKEETIRGFSGVDLLVIDEAARVSDDLYRSVRPMLAVSGGRMLALSTPFGKRGWFFEAWQSAGATSGSDWKRVRVTADDCPRITEAFLEEERRELGDWWFRQEYFCEFVDTTSSLFRYEDIQGAFDPEVKPLFDAGEAPTDEAVDLLPLP